MRQEQPGIGGFFEAEQQLRRDNGSSFWASLFAQAVDRDDLSQGVIWTVLDITERRYSEVVANMLYRISNAVSITSDLDDLYRRIHRVLNDHLNAKNFFVGLLNDEKTELEFTYFEDEMDSFKGLVFDMNDEQSVSLSVEVIRLERPLIVTQESVLTGESLGGDTAKTRFKYISRKNYLKEKGLISPPRSGMRHRSGSGFR